MKRIGALASVLTVLALGAGAAIAAGGASIHLKAPSSIAAGKAFRVTASGHAPSKGRQIVFVMFTTKSACAKTLDRAELRNDEFVPFHGKTGTLVPHGGYRVRTDRVKANRAGPGILCGYLYRGSQAISSKPEAHSGRAIRFTGAASAGRGLSVAVVH